MSLLPENARRKLIDAAKSPKYKRREAVDEAIKWVRTNYPEYFKEDIEPTYFEYSKLLNKIKAPEIPMIIDLSFFNKGN